LLPTESSVEVAEELARWYPLPYWQFTLSVEAHRARFLRLQP
jgi:hypothetical protein